MSDYAVSKQVVDRYIERGQPESPAIEGRPKMGQTCTIHGYIVKCRSYDKTPKYPFKTSWQHNNLRPTKAVYIGYRTVHEGITEMEVDGDGEGYTWSYPVFHRRNSLYVWVFVSDEKSSPFYVYPEDVEFEVQS